MLSHFSSYGFRFTQLLLLGCVVAAPCRGQTLYDFGNPTAEEQLYLEYINRARANPSAEGALLADPKDAEIEGAYNYGPSPPGWIVDLKMLKDEFNEIALASPPAPPLAPNAKLMGISRSHSNWMLVTKTQAHNEPTNTYYSRMTTAGYNPEFAAENVSAYAKSIWFGHASFEVDWGSDDKGRMSGGMQGPPRGHRVNIHNANYREIGIGCETDTTGVVGPQLVTQDFGTQFSSPTFGTGVAYYDLNSNNFYDIGEEISGLRVEVDGASYYCTTAKGGGWAIPVPSVAATRTVSFTGLNIKQNVKITIPASTNAKADLKLAYAPPTITSPSTAAVGTPHSLNFNAVGGATSYKWNRWSAGAAAAENCDSEANITRSTTGNHAVLNTAIKQEGKASFHLTIRDFENQSFELKSLYYGNPSAEISFQSQVCAAFTTELFKVQVKEEGGIWIDVYKQAGLGSSGETQFTERTAALTAMVGKAFRIRFLQQYTSGSIYDPDNNTAGNNIGWFVDAIDFKNVSTLANPTLTTLTTHTGSFTPAVTGSYLMSVTPVISKRDYPASYQTLHVTSDNPTPLNITSHPTSTVIDSGGTTTLSVAATGTEPLTYQWYQGTSGTSTTPVGTNSPSFTTPALSATTSYWVRISNAENPNGVNSTTATVTVNGITVSVTVAPDSVLENGLSNLVYTFTRTGPTTSALTASFSVQGSATLNSDYRQSGAATYTASAGTVTFAAGSASKTVTIDPAAETVVEPDETVVLTVLAGASYAPGASSVATGTIMNDDAKVSVAVSPTSVSEDGSDNLVYTFTRSGATSGTLTVKFSIRGTATKITDYTQSGAATFSTTGSVIIDAGATTATVTLDPVSDTKVEANETAILAITSGTGYTLGSPSAATGTITNDDATVGVVVSPTSVTEDGVGNLVYTFTRTGATAGPLDVSFSVGGTATFATDYTQYGASSFSPTTGTVTFAAGATKAIVTLNPTGDSTAEANETAVLTLISGPGYAPTTSASATGTITNDDTNISVAVLTSNVMEDGITDLVYTFTRTGKTSSVTANFSVGGTATYSSDYSQTGAASYTATTGTVTFAAGATKKSITLNPITDSIAEPDEPAVLTITAGTGYTPASPEAAIGTISNDEATP